MDFLYGEHPIGLVGLLLESLYTYYQPERKAILFFKHNNATRDVFHHEVSVGIDLGIDDLVFRTFFAARSAPLPYWAFPPNTLSIIK